MLRRIRKQIRLYQTKFSFGASTAIITNLGLIMGLDSGPNAKFSIIASVLVIALADNISDSFGIHIYQESERLDKKEIVLSTSTNFLTRLLVSLVFVLLFMLLPIKLAVICSLIWGLALLIFISYIIARDENENPYLAVAEHLSIAFVVILLSEFVGKWLISLFGR